MRAIRVIAILISSGLLGCSSNAQVAPPTPSAPQIKPEVEAEIDNLLGLIRDRLLIMHEVARWKWQEGLPIADPKREQAVIQQTVDLAQESGLDADLAARFMTAQIEAGKQIQQQDFAAWKGSSQTEKSASSDLSQELRPKIDRLSKSLVISLTRLAPHLAAQSVQKVLQQRAAELSQQHGLDAEACATATAPLLDR